MTILLISLGLVFLYLILLGVTPAEVRITAGTAPSSPAAGVISIFASAADGKLEAKDSSGNVCVLGGMGAKDYRLIRIILLTGSGTYTPTTGATAIFVAGVGGGGGGGGCATAITNSAGAGGGGGGAYAASWITTLAASYDYVSGGGGAGGTAGANNGTVGADSTWGTTVVVADGGLGGIADTVALIHGTLGGAGGLAAGCTGDIKITGQPGGFGIALAAAQAVSGFGGPSMFGGGANGLKTQSAGANAVNYGGGGSGGCILSGGASVAGGNGGNGAWIVWEYAG